MLHIISLGAGVQSTTMALMAAHGEITPMPHCAIFADTGWEPKVVYDHLGWLTGLSASGQIPFPIITVRAGDLWEAATTIKRTKDGKRTYTETGLPVYTVGEKQNGLGKRQCTRAFKITPINQKVHELLGRKRFTKKDGILATMWIGISIDEAMRKKPSAIPQIQSRWPLLEKNITRQACLQWLKNNNYPTPPRSACTFCPYHSDVEWLKLTPTEFADAVEKEKQLQLAYKTATALNTTPYLHNSRMPLDQVIFDPTPRKEKMWQTDLFNNECEGMCGV